MGSALLAAAPTDATTWVAIIVSMAALVFTGVSLKRNARYDATSAMSQRIDALESECKDLRAEAAECERLNRRLTRDNQELTRRVLKLENGE